MKALERWGELDDQGRRVALDGLLERLPNWLELVEPGLQPRFRDARNGESWRLFTGGAVTLGATNERLEAIDALRVREPLLLFDAVPYLPVRTVRVSPFFLMEQPILEPDGEPKILILDVKKELERLLAVRGQRLPTEAEWEFAWAAVQQQPEHWMPGYLELVADGWRSHLAELEGVDPLVPGGPQVLKSVSVRETELESIVPGRAPLSGFRTASIRAALDVPR